MNKSNKFWKKVIILGLDPSLIRFVYNILHPLSQIMKGKLQYFLLKSLNKQEPSK